MKRNALLDVILSSSVLDLLKILPGLIALILSWLAYRHSQLVAKRNKQNKDYDFINTIDTLMLQHPMLKAIFDSQEKLYLPLFSDNPFEALNFQNKLDAFCYLIINNLERVFGQSIAKDHHTTIWENYFVLLMLRSSRLRRIVTREVPSIILNTEFQKKLVTLQSYTKKVLEIPLEFDWENIDIEPSQLAYSNYMNSVKLALNNARKNG